MTEPTAVTVHHGDSLRLLRAGRDLGYDYDLGYEPHRLFPDSSIDAVVTDPPYGLEFMGKDWDAPWQVRGINTDAGFNGGGISATRAAPSFTSSTNPNCLNCGGKARGRRDGTALVAVCLCDRPRFPNVRAVEMRAFQDWCTDWAVECLRVLKPGGHLLAFGGTRTYHRLGCAIEDAGFEIRDSCLDINGHPVHDCHNPDCDPLLGVPGAAWLFGSGFPKSLDVSKAIDRAAGVDREVLGTRTDGRYGSGFTDQAKKALGKTVAGESATGFSGEMGLITEPATEDAQRWDGWGTALKPAFEPLVIGRKPLVGTVAANVVAHGTGALNINGCRVPHADAADLAESEGKNRHAQFGSEPGGNNVYGDFSQTAVRDYDGSAGRWPPNVVLDEDAAAALDQQAGDRPNGHTPGRRAGLGYGSTSTGGGSEEVWWGSGGPSRYFHTFRYEPKAGTEERPTVDGVLHPTVKPLDLMRWLVRLVTAPGGVVLDLFAGSGTTVEACLAEGMRCVAIERDATYVRLINSRIDKPIQTALFP